MGTLGMWRTEVKCTSSEVVQVAEIYNSFEMLKFKGKLYNIY